MMRNLIRMVGASATVAVAVALIASTTGAVAADAASSASDAAHACGIPAAGHARCGALRLLNPSQNWHPHGPGTTPARGHGGGGTGSTTPTSGYFPADLQSAYGLGAAISATAPGGSAPTVAIVDAYDDPNAAADLAYYRSKLSGAQDPNTLLTDGQIPPICSSAGQSGCITFKKVDQSGGSNYPRANKGWAEEISLDLDMVSAVCPTCNIVLVEASSSSFTNLKAAVDYAKTLTPAVVTNSYGGNEFNSETGYNGTYSSQGSTAVTVATGDSGYGAEFPAAAPGITAVGGTSLTYSGTGNGLSWKPQTVWSGAGAGCSAYESQPKYQNAYSVSSTCSSRQIGDVAAVADPNTGVAVYDTYNESGWLVFGGTSASTQIIGAMYGLAAFTGNEQAAPGALYANASGNLTPVSSGSDGSCGSYLCDATQSISGIYNGPTGLGTPSGIGAFDGTGGAPAQPGISVMATPSSTSTTGGSPASYTVTVTPSGGFTGNVSLTASGCPADVTCSFASNTVDITGTSSVQTTLTVPTTSNDTGSYTIDISGTGSGVSAGTSVGLTVLSATTGTMNVKVTGGTVKKKGPNYHVPVTVAATDASTSAGIGGATVTLNIYSGSTCSGPVVASGSGTTGSNGQITFNFTTRTAGTWCGAAGVTAGGYADGSGQGTFTS